MHRVDVEERICGMERHVLIHFEADRSPDRRETSSLSCCPLSREYEAYFYLKFILQEFIYPRFNNDVAMLMVLDQPTGNALNRLLGFVQIIFEFEIKRLNTERLAYTHPEPFLVRIKS